MTPQQRIDRTVRPARVWAVAFLLLALVAPYIGFAQSDEVAPRSNLRYLQPDTRRPEDTAAQTETSQSGVVDLPYSKVFKDTDTIDLFQPTHIQPDRGIPFEFEPRVGSAGARVDAGVLRGRFGIPFVGKGFRREDAEIKIANFYIDLRALSATFLYSDNVNQSEFRREDGTILALRLDFAVFIPFTEHFRISAAGSFLYLPLKNRAGFAVFDPLKQFEYDPYFRSQIAYDMNIGNWDIEVYDDFNIAQIPYSLQLSYGYFDGAFEDPQREGRYSYRTGVSGNSTQVFEDRSPYGSFDPGLVQARNNVGAKASRLLPTETRMEVGAMHSDFWYLSGDQNVLRLPRNADFGYVLLKSERDNLRFKPFARYTISHYDYNETWEHHVEGGVQGPITQYIDFYGAAGVRWLDLNRSETTARIQLRHQISAYTWHAIEYDRDVTEPDRDLENRWVYRINQIIGDGLTADFYGSYATFDDLDNTGTGSDEWRSGLRFTYVVSPRTTLQAAGIFTRYDYKNPKAPDSDTWIGRFTAVHRFTPTFEGQLQYTYTDRASNRRGDSYYENFTTVSLIKYF